MEVMEEQTGQQKAMKVQLGKLEDQLKKLRLDLEAKQNSHQNAVLEKQERLHNDVNKIKSKEIRGDLSPRRKDEIENQRQQYAKLKA